MNSVFLAVQTAFPSRMCFGVFFCYLFGVFCLLIYKGSFHLSMWLSEKRHSSVCEVSQSAVTVPEKEENLLKVPSHCIEFTRIFFCSILIAV